MDSAKGVGIATDLYELTMMQGYHAYDRNIPVVFELFFRSQPFGGGYSILAGVQDVISHLQSLSFSEGELAYLESLGPFQKDFLDELSRFRFSGDVYAMPEGEVVFPNEPLLRVHAPLAEAQVVESMILNILNFQTLIATKAARITHAAHGKSVLEMGMRRAQGPDGALSAARAAYIGGVEATSNTLAGMKYGLPVRGTMAHSWVMTFDTELEAFERYAQLYPDRCIFLIDTYDTLGSGIENAITVGAWLKERGKSFGVRLDSGDLEYLSHAVRKRLDDAGFPDAKIAVSNELDEWIVNQLVTDGAPIDLWGIGTHLVTGGSQSSFPGVYKLAARYDETINGMRPVMKVSDNPEKSSNPGIKQVFRFFTESGEPLGDLVSEAGEPIPGGEAVTFHHPSALTQKYRMEDYDYTRPLLSQVMKNGAACSEPETLPELRSRAVSRVNSLPHTYRRMINPHVYKVSLSRRLKEMKLSILRDHGIYD
ncbi:MAG: nicotinate phosphoribosyltransferase [Spirochaetaceae bacterium]|nr:MAG: nicotinate phosphoribosyltransferase [Spirochaetaceae bacterium]